LPNFGRAGFYFWSASLNIAGQEIVIEFDQPYLEDNLLAGDYFQLDEFYIV
jgi:hypothetical protein